jgi:hypothetical protein
LACFAKYWPFLTDVFNDFSLRHGFVSWAKLGHSLARINSINSFECSWGTRSESISLVLCKMLFCNADQLVLIG